MPRFMGNDDGGNQRGRAAVTLMRFAPPADDRGVKTPNTSPGPFAVANTLTHDRPSTGSIAPAWRRVLAGLVDSVTVGVPLWWFLSQPAISNVVGAILMWTFILAVGVGYPAVSHGYAGRTFGKSSFGISVVDRDGETASFLQALSRASVAILVPFILGLGTGFYSPVIGSAVWASMVLGDGLVMLLHPRHRAFHDIVAGTWVVSGERGRFATDTTMRGQEPLP